MSAADERRNGARQNDSPVRHRRVPSRALGDKLIVARPSDGAPVVLAATAAFVWRQLDDWTMPDALNHELGTAFPDVPRGERQEASAAILAALTDDDLVERA